MFVNNKYTLWYYNIIQNAIDATRYRHKRDNSKYVYYEQHHIIPKSLGGNNLDNLVLLTAKEHFICHMLLTKMCIDDAHIYKMRLAFNMMSNYNGKTTSKLYTTVKQQVYAGISARMAGVPKSSESIQKMVATRRRNGSYKHTLETKQKMRESHKHRPNQSNETKQKRSQTLQGRKFSENHKQSLSKSLKGRIPWNKGIKTGPHKIPKSNETRRKLSIANKKPKAKCCCLDCGREISTNNLDRHRASKLCHSAI